MRKRILSISLSLAMVLGVYTPASADVSQDAVISESENTPEVSTQSVIAERTNSLLGDLNQNNQIDLTDAQIVLKFALKIQQMNDSQSLLADVDQSGTVDLKDAQLILKKALKINNNYDDTLVETVSINKTSAAMDIGNTLLLTATAYPANAINNKISWSSSDIAIATVSQDGQVQAVGAGTATITASAGGHSAKCVITVNDNRSIYADNCRDLKNYIIIKGATNSDGNKVISMTVDMNTMGIVYDASNNELRFLYALSGSESLTTCSMQIGMNGAELEQAEYIITDSRYRVGCSAVTTLDAKSYNNTTNLYFRPTKLVGLSENNIQEMANSALQTAFVAWDLLLFTKLNKSMSDYGFTAYR